MEQAELKSNPVLCNPSEACCKLGHLLAGHTSLLTREWGILRLPDNGYPQNCSSLSTLKPSDLGRALPDWMGAASPSKHQGLGAMCPSPSALVTFGEVVGQ